MGIDLPHLSLRFSLSQSDDSVLKSAVVAIWWAQSRISDYTSMASVFLLNDLPNKQVSVITNNWQVVDAIIKEPSFESSFKKWYELEVLSDKDWDINFTPERVLRNLCSNYKCISSILEFSKVQKKLLFATVRHIKPEDVKNLSQMLLLFGTLHREENLKVHWDKLHPVVANFLEKMMRTGFIDLAWLGYDKKNPESLIWKEELGYLI